MGTGMIEAELGPLNSSEEKVLYRKIPISLNIMILN